MSRQNGSSDTATSGRKRKESGSGTMKCRVKRSDERLKIASGFLPASCRHVPLMLQKGSFRKAKGQELSYKRARMTSQKLPFYKTTHKRLIYNADKKYGLLPSKKHERTASVATSSPEACSRRVIRAETGIGRLPAEWGVGLRKAWPATARQNGSPDDGKRTTDGREASKTT